MTELPHVVLSAAVSLDNYLDDTTRKRLVLSNDADLDQVKRLRGEFDAIMVGAETVRRDNPSLRAVGGPNPRKVTLTATGALNPQSHFFDATTKEPPIVFCRDSVIDQLPLVMDDHAHVFLLHEGAGLPYMLKTLWSLGIRSLMVEGGGTLHTQFLTAGLADELRLAIAPFFVGDDAAPRFTDPGVFPHDKDHRMQLDKVEHLGDMAVHHYRLSKKNARALVTASNVGH